MKLVLDNGYSRFTGKEVKVLMGKKVVEVALDEALEGLQVSDPTQSGEVAPPPHRGGRGLS